MYLIYISTVVSPPPYLGLKAVSRSRVGSFMSSIQLRALWKLLRLLRQPSPSVK